MVRLGYLLLFLSIIASCTNRPKDSFDDSVIKVNEANMTGFDFSKKLVRKFIEQDIKYPKQEIMTVLKKQIIEDFIIQSIYEDYAREQNILVKKEVLDSEFNSFKDNYPDNDSFEIFLNESGINKSIFRDTLKEKVLRDLVKENLISSQQITVDAKEISDFYNSNKDKYKREDQIHLKQIIFENEEDGIKIKELLKKANNKNFETLANKYSLGPEKKDGGDLGWVDLNSYSAFTEAANTSSGQISDIIKSENGYHIFKVVEKRNGRLLALKEVETNIKNELIRKKESEFLNTWIKDKAKSSKITVNEDLINKISVNRPTNL